MGPPIDSTQNTQNNFGKTTSTKSFSTSSKDITIPPKTMNSVPPLDTLMSLPAIEYNIVEDMKKARANICLFELTKITNQRDILLRALGKTSTGDVTSSNKESSKSPDALTSTINALCMEEENSLFPPFLLSFELFKFNFHNCLVDFGALVNVMPLSVAKKSVLNGVR